MLRLLKISMLPGPAGGVPAWAMVAKVTSLPVAVRAARPPATSRLGDRDARDAGAPTAACPPPRPPFWVGRVLVIAYSAVAPDPHPSWAGLVGITVVVRRRARQPSGGGADPPNPGAGRVR